MLISFAETIQLICGLCLNLVFSEQGPINVKLFPSVECGCTEEQYFVLIQKLNRKQKEVQVMRKKLVNPKKAGKKRNGNGQ